MYMDELFALIMMITCSVFPVYVYHATDFIPWLLRGKSVIVDRFWEHRQDVNPRMTLPEFIFKERVGFFTKLQSCATCLLFWTSVVTTFHTAPLFIPFVWLVSIITYKTIWKIERM
jgi:hypothetical protein